MVEVLSKVTNKVPRRPPAVLVLLPTRELANQVGDVFKSLNKNLSVHCIYGGVSYGPQGIFAIRCDA